MRQIPSVLVTGGAGFIGSHLADELTRHGCPYHCTSCAKDDLRDAFRKRPLDVLLAELETLVAQRTEVPRFPYPGSPEYTLPFGACHDDDHYLERFGAFSEIQEARPLPLGELEALA